MSSPATAPSPDRVTVLYYGKILATGTPDEIQANARVREVYLGMRE